MSIKDLKYYCSLFAKLRRDYKNGGAPHKPILLLSVIQSYQQGIFTSNEISIVPEIVGLFKSNWKQLVTSNHDCLFTLPFYHMNTEPFWTLVPNKGCEIWVKSKSSMRSFANLITAVKFALIDEELKILLQNKEESNILLQFILNEYFPDTKQNYSKNGNKYISDIEDQIINDSQAKYRLRLLEIRKELDAEEFQEEVFIRSAIFKKEIPKIYNFTCCISGFRVDAIENISMIDACHIIPFSESYNDTISNGIALCPNLHRAFDRGLISIDQKFRVIINKNFHEPNNSVYNIKQFENTRIILPENPSYFPCTESMNHHMNRFGFK